MTSRTTTPDGFVGLRPGETPQAAIARLDASLPGREFTAAIESDEGQRLMTAAAAAARRARRDAAAELTAASKVRPEYDLDAAPRMKLTDPLHGPTSHLSEQTLFRGYGVKL